MSFLDLGPRSFTYENKLVFLSNHWVFSAKFSMKVCRNKEMKIHQDNAGQMTKMAAMPIYGETL